VLFHSRSTFFIKPGKGRLQKMHHVTTATAHCLCVLRQLRVGSHKAASLAACYSSPFPTTAEKLHTQTKGGMSPGHKDR
jgi:hypothetical protein